MTLKKIALVTTALLIAATFAGCSKKPRRPNPLDTVMDSSDSSRTNNPRGGRPETGLNPTSVFDGGTTLTSRNSSENWDEIGQRGILEDVLFSFDSASISPAEREKLNDAATYLEENIGVSLLLEGHCDWRGTGEYNLALGDKRSKSVESYLLTLGIDPQRLQTLSKGDLNATEGASSAQMSKERRVELVVVE